MAVKGHSVSEVVSYSVLMSPPMKQLENKGSEGEDGGTREWRGVNIITSIIYNHLYYIL